MTTKFFDEEIFDQQNVKFYEENIFSLNGGKPNNWVLMFTAENSERVKCALCEELSPDIHQIAQDL